MGGNILYRNRPASNNPGTANEIQYIYENAIQITNNRSLYRGMLASTGVLSSIIFFTIIAPLAVNGLIAGHYTFSEGFFICSLLLGPLGILLITRFELFSFFDEPVLFNRANQTVSVFRVKRNWWRPFSNWPADIQTYPWNRIHAEVRGGAGGSLASPQIKSALWLIVQRSTGDHTPADSFPVGYLSGFAESRLQLWEHIRQYMNETGVSIREGDELWREDLSNPSLAFIDSLFPVHSSVRMGLNLIFFPLALLFAFGVFLVVLTGKPAYWPGEVRKAAGEGPLNGEQIRALVEEEIKRMSEYPANEDTKLPDHERWA